MAYSIKGLHVHKDGKEIDQGSDHRDAVRSAQDRAKPKTGTSLSDVDPERYEQAFPRKRKTQEPADQAPNEE